MERKVMSNEISKLLNELTDKDLEHVERYLKFLVAERKATQLLETFNSAKEINNKANLYLVRD